MRCAVQIRGCPRAAGFPRGDHVSQVPPWGSRSRTLGTTSSAPAPPAPIRTRGWAAEDAHLSRWRPFLSLTWTPSWAQSAQSPSSGSPAWTPDTRQPCTEASVPGPEPPTCLERFYRGQGRPRGQSPLPHQALTLDVPAPRVPPPLPRYESRLGDFLGVAATLRTGVRIDERWRPRRAYVGSGAAAQARAQPRRLCPRRETLRSRPGPLGKPPSRQHWQAPPGAPVLLLGQSTGQGPKPAHLQHLVLLLTPEGQGRRPLLEALAVLGPRPRGAWTSSQRWALAAAAPAEAATPPGRGGEGESWRRAARTVSPGARRPLSPVPAAAAAAQGGAGLEVRGDGCRGSRRPCSSASAARGVWGRLRAVPPGPSDVLRMHRWLRGARQCAARQCAAGGGVCVRGRVCLWLQLPQFVPALQTSPAPLSASWSWHARCFCPGCFLWAQPPARPRHACCLSPAEILRFGFVPPSVS
ncbi:uncharacterized protein LOC141575649 [Camelus bactrianus]|uniref:Uncharacterized protein LOC141575649 n=1 Tax=Camelus bactrianus TaxID=9837 RepID=A0AC58PN69_CAMBA